MHFLEKHDSQVYTYPMKMEKNIFEIEGGGSFEGEIFLPGDKSISHRVLIFSSLAAGKSRILNLSTSKDVLSTINVLRLLGVRFKKEIKNNRVNIFIEGRGGEFNEPANILNCGNSGTTARVMAGVLAGSPFFSVLTGDASLRRRPMRRIVDPLREMGAAIEGRNGGNFLPLSISGKTLKGKDFEIPIASAQVKTALLLAGLMAKGKTSVKEPFQSRNHTENLLPFYGVEIKMEGGKIEVEGGQILKPVDYEIPGDISSASFFIAGAILCRDSSLKIINVLLNPTRTGFLNKIKDMGANIQVKLKVNEPEPAGDIYVSSCQLKGIEVKEEEVPLLIDEIPLLALLGAFAKGKTVIRGARELRVKESDRIKTTCEILKRMGAEVEELEDGLIVEGGKELKSARLRAFGDHRIAMLGAIAGCAVKGKTIVEGFNSVAISFPEFRNVLKSVYKLRK